jgi:hypothetical protein
MKTLKRSKVAPINVMPGDSIEVTYEETDQHGKVHRKESITRKFDKSMAVDILAIAELEQPELDALDLNAGIAGVFGESREQAE